MIQLIVEPNLSACCEPKTKTKVEYRGFDPRTSRKPVKEYDCRASDLPIDLIPHHHNSGIFITLYTLNNLKIAIRYALDRLIPSFLGQIQQQSNALGKKNVRKKSVIPIGTQTGGKPPSKNGRHRRGRPFDLPGEVLPCMAWQPRAAVP